MVTTWFFSSMRVRAWVTQTQQTRKLSLLLSTNLYAIIIAISCKIIFSGVPPGWSNYLQYCYTIYTILIHCIIVCFTQQMNWIEENRRERYNEQNIIIILAASIILVLSPSPLGLFIIFTNKKNETRNCLKTCFLLCFVCIYPCNAMECPKLLTFKK